jgi:hypothetical protein
VNINIVLEKAMRKRKMQKPDKLLRKYPLEKVIPAAATMRKVLLVNSDPIWPNVERRVVSVVEFKTLICWDVRGAMSGTTVLVLP